MSAESETREASNEDDFAEKVTNGEKYAPEFRMFDFANVRSSSERTSATTAVTTPVALAALAPEARRPVADPETGEVME